MGDERASARKWIPLVLINSGAAPGAGRLLRLSWPLVRHLSREGRRGFEGIRGAATVPNGINKLLIYKDPLTGQEHL